MVILAMFVAVLLAQEPIAAPSPQPSPLKQIIEVKARPLCTTLGRNVQIALVGLMKNDEVIESGRREFAKMAWDQAQGSAALGIDRLALKNVASAMVHNLYHDRPGARRSDALPAQSVERRRRGRRSDEGGAAGR